MIFFIIGLIALAWFSTLAFLILMDKHQFDRLTLLLEKFDKERSGLLDRIMASNFTQYKQAEVAEKAALHLIQQPEEEEEPSWTEVGV